MADGARDRMIDSAVKLLATHGFQGASFSSVLEDANAPRGSIYYHFPGGKDELILEALSRFSDRAETFVSRMRGLSIDGVVRGFVDIWRQILARSEFHSGCAVLGATVSASVPEVIDRAGDVFRTWDSQLASVLRESGIPQFDAAEFATMLMASCEGAVVICRAEHSYGPLDRVERQLLRLAAVYGDSA